jgi:ribonucleoside-triphosphate reductase (formate)
MRDVLIEFQEETGCLYNLEATPAEGTSYRLAKIDKKQYPEIITQGTNEPYYTNSVQLPVNYTDDLFEYLDNQDSLQTKFTGGTVVHGFLGEEIKNIEVVKNLIKTIFTKYKLPYFSVTPTFSVCPVHGYISGEHHKCPKCLVDQECEIYSRVVGYIRPVKH